MKIQLHFHLPSYIFGYPELALHQAGGMNKGDKEYFQREILIMMMYET